MSINAIDGNNDKLKINGVYLSEERYNFDAVNGILTIKGVWHEDLLFLLGKLNEVEPLIVESIGIGKNKMFINSLVIDSIAESMVEYDLVMFDLAKVRL